jgi:choline dehydrogenase-like flavoprotein
LAGSRQADYFDGIVARLPESSFMALRILNESLFQTTELSASVCIVGAGIAGLVAAIRLARDKNRRIVVVESGFGKAEPCVSALNEIDNPAGNYGGYQTGRCRGLGGTSLLWGGKLLPLSAQDTQARPQLGLEGWPIDIAELEQYRDASEDLMGVDSRPYDGSVAEQLDPRGLLPRNDVDFCLRWPKRPTTANHNLAYVLRKEIRSLENLEIWLGATVSDFRIDLSCGRVVALTAVSQTGRTLRVMADDYLLAAGTLESTRLLLLADRQSNHSISRNCDALGRYFNDHLGLHVAVLRPRNQTLTNLALSDRYTFGATRHLHFELRPEVQNAHGIGSAYFDIGAQLPDSSALTTTKRVIQGLKRGKPIICYQDINDIIKDSPSLFWTAQWKSVRKQKYWPSNACLPIEIRVEQLPQWSNRISLSDQKDALGVPKLQLEWKKTDAEEKAFRTMVAKLDRCWNQHLAGVCELDWISEVLHPDLRMVDSAVDLAHPAGSTRMGINPHYSVVDPRLRVHRIPNLSVASASVFPCSGSANPTLTILLLAMRAADTLAMRN